MDFGIDPNELARLIDGVAAGSNRLIREIRRLNFAPIDISSLLNSWPWTSKPPDDIDALLKPSLTVREVRQLGLIDDTDIERAAGDMTRRLLDDADRRLFGVTAHAYSDVEESSLSLDSIEEAMAELKAMGPFPIELWFVDCRDLYVAFTQSLPQEPVTHADVGAGTYLSMPMSHMPVIEWYMRYFDPEKETIAKKSEGPAERQRLREAHDYEQVWPWFCAIPGVWVKMNDGSARRLGPDDVFSQLLEQAQQKDAG